MQFLVRGQISPFLVGFHLMARAISANKFTRINFSISNRKLHVCAAVWLPIYTGVHGSIKVVTFSCSQFFTSHFGKFCWGRILNLTFASRKWRIPFSSHIVVWTMRYDQHTQTSQSAHKCLQIQQTLRYWSLYLHAVWVLPLLVSSVSHSAICAANKSWSITVLRTQRMQYLLFSLSFFTYSLPVRIMHEQGQNGIETRCSLQIGRVLSWKTLINSKYSFVACSACGGVVGVRQVQLRWKHGKFENIFFCVRYCSVLTRLFLFLFPQCAAFRFGTVRFELFMNMPFHCYLWLNGLPMHKAHFFTHSINLLLFCSSNIFYDAAVTAKVIFSLFFEYEKKE